jgi:hypothetical protein
LLLALAAPDAYGRELWATEDGSSALELQAFYKALGAGLRMQSGLVEGTSAIAGLLAEARSQLPPEQAALLPESPALPLQGATSGHSARIWGRLLLRDRLELQAGWQLTALIASDPSLIGATSLGGIPVSSSESASRRLVDLDPALIRSEGLLVQQSLDLLAVKTRAPFGDVTLGRQVLSWGSGRLWNPTDLLSPFGPTDVDREVRRGVDALRVSVPLAATSQLDLLWLPQLAGRDQGAVARGQLNLGGFDVAPSVAKYVRDLVLGLDVSGDLGPLGAHAELAWTTALDRDGEGERERFLRAVAGLDWRPTDKLVLSGEYYFNGYGATGPESYLAVLSSPRVTRGEVFGAGRHYVGVVASWQASELLAVQGTAIANVGDPSVVIVPALEYWAEQSVLVRLGGYVPIGRRPDPSALQRLTTEDLLSSSPAWNEATRSLGLRSEYGASPFGLFAQVAIYLL